MYADMGQGLAETLRDGAAQVMLLRDKLGGNLFTGPALQTSGLRHRVTRSVVPGD